MKFDDNTKALIALVSATDGQVYLCNCTNIIKRYLFYICFKKNYYKYMINF